MSLTPSNGSGSTTGTSDQLLANNGTGGFSNVNVGSGLDYDVPTNTLSAEGGAPADADYIIQTTNPDLPNAQVLDDLVPGLISVDSAGVIMSHPSPVFGGVYLGFKDAKPIKLIVDSSGSGETLLGTVPAGKIWVTLPGQLYTNSTGGAISGVSINPRRGGTVYSQNGTTTVGSNATVQTATNATMLTAGEELVLTTSASGLTASLAALEIDDSEGLVPIFLTNLVSGDNILYTCPSDIMATPGNSSTAGISLSGNSNAGFQFRNISGGALNARVIYKPSVGSPITLILSTSVSNNTNFAMKCPTFLSAGDQLILNLSASASTSFVFGYLLEITV